jgi:anti-anti-sigma factor
VTLDEACPDGASAWPVVRLRGEIDLSNAEALGAAAEGAVSNRARGLVLDLSEVTFLDSTGLRLIFRLARRLRDRQQALRLVVPDGARIARLLRLSGVASVAEVVPQHSPTGPSMRTTGSPS